ncbi:MAG: hypothetical protein H0W20_14280 [Chthoniobacterales bacterium]|nr:hypothetical protein [Chthoniobacterales bacterium]
MARSVLENAAAMARPCSAFIREDRPEGTHIKKSFVIVISLFVVGLILGGIAFDRQRAKERQRIAAQKTAAEQAKNKVPPLPQWGALPARGGRSGSQRQRDVHQSLPTDVAQPNSDKLTA